MLIVSKIQRHTGEFPNHENREFQKPYQGILISEQAC